MKLTCDAGGRLAMFFFRLQPQYDVNAADHQHTFFFLDLADCIGNQHAIASRDLTRLQRASVGADESTGRGRHNVVERGGVLLNTGRVALEVVLGDGAVDAERYGIRFAREPREPQWSSDAFDTNL